MGIPRLLQRFKDAGHVPTDVIGDTSTPSESRKTAIIDGPSLAHIVARTVKQSQDLGSDVGSPPLYNEIAEQTVVWLDRLCLLGFTINTIYFDGALPASKRPVRLERLTNYATNLDAYKSLHDAASRTFRVQSSSEIWKAGALAAARRNLAPEPFLVMAVVEGLLDSPYASKVQLVPGEADAFCIAAALALYQEEDESEPFIFTSDSDLIVFDSGARTKIVFLHSLDLNEDDGKLLLFADTIHPAAITARLGLPNLLELAYCMEQDPHRTVTDAVSHIKAKSPHGPRYDTFKQQYDTSSEEAMLARLMRNPARRSRLNRLDARTAEVVHQLPTTFPQIDSFLPFLFEDPSKTSTFRNIGQEYRQLAYSILVLSVPLNSSPPTTPTHILEHHRSTTIITPISLPVLPIPTKLTLHKSLLKHFPRSQWTHELLLLTLSNYITRNIPIPRPSTIFSSLSRLSQSSPSGYTTWEAIHFRAAMHATWYSLRMLQQILSWCDVTRRDFQALSDKLRDLPSILEFCRPEQWEKTGEEEEGEEVKGMERVEREDVDVIFAILEKEHGEFRRVEEGRVTREGKRERRKRRKVDRHHVRKVEGDEVEKEEENSNNPFALLLSTDNEGEV